MEDYLIREQGVKLILPPRNFYNFILNSTTSSLLIFNLRQHLIILLGISPTSRFFESLLGKDFTITLENKKNITSSAEKLVRTMPSIIANQL